MARRRHVTQGTDSGGDGVPIMPPELAVPRPGHWSSAGSFARAPSRWLHAHGIDESDWRSVWPVRRASRRAHARTVAELDALERTRPVSAGASLTDPA
jgi:hypothetical protein